MHCTVPCAKAQKCFPRKITEHTLQNWKKHQRQIQCDSLTISYTQQKHFFKLLQI